MNDTNKSLALTLSFLAAFTVASPALAGDLAWAWVDTATASSTPPANRQYNSAGGTITVQRAGRGNYVVRFPNIRSNPSTNPLAAARGVTHVLPVGTPNVFCGINAFATAGDDVGVLCTADTAFIILYYDEYRGTTFGSGAYASFRPDSGDPQAFTSWSSLGGNNRSKYVAAGVYELQSS